MTNTTASPKRQISVRYVRSPHIVEAQVNGIYGGVSSAGQIAMAVYSERMALPETATVTVTPDASGSFANATFSEAPATASDNERTVHAVLSFDLDMARAMRNWLDLQLAVLEAGGNA